VGGQDDGKYLLITQYKGTAPVNKLYYYDLSAGFDPSAVDAGSGLPVPPPLFDRPSPRKGSSSSSPTFGGRNGWQLVKLIDDWEAQYEYIANDETRFWFKTNHKAPRNKIIILDLLHPNEVSLSSDPPPFPSSDARGAERVARSCAGGRGCAGLCCVLRSG